MTYLDVVFSYGALPGENELRAIDSMREVYGIRGVSSITSSELCGLSMTRHA